MAPRVAGRQSAWSERAGDVGGDAAGLIGEGHVAELDRHRRAALGLEARRHRQRAFGLAVLARGRAGRVCFSIRFSLAAILRFIASVFSPVRNDFVDDLGDEEPDQSEDADVAGVMGSSQSEDASSTEQDDDDDHHNDLS